MNMRSPELSQRVNLILIKSKRKTLVFEFASSQVMEGCLPALGNVQNLSCPPATAFLQGTSWEPLAGLSLRALQFGLSEHFLICRRGFSPKKGGTIEMEAQVWGVPVGLYQSHQLVTTSSANAWSGPGHIPSITWVGVGNSPLY